MKKRIKMLICINGHNKDIVGKAKNGQCKVCHKICQINFRRRHGIRERRKICPKGHDKDIVGRDKRGSCKVCVRIWGRDFRRKMDKKKLKKYNKKYQKEHKQEMRSQQTNYTRNKRLTNSAFKLSLYLRVRLNKAIKRDSKRGSAVRDLGCSIEFLKQYIEKKFYGKMTWENWGTVWELDHKKALMFFDLTDRKQFLKACNYRNLQPLTKLDHYKKTAKEKPCN